MVERLLFPEGVDKRGSSGGRQSWDEDLYYRREIDLCCRIWASLSLGELCCPVLLHQGGEGKGT